MVSRSTHFNRGDTEENVHIFVACPVKKPFSLKSLSSWHGQWFLPQCSEWTTVPWGWTVKTWPMTRGWSYTTHWEIVPPRLDNTKVRSTSTWTWSVCRCSEVLVILNVGQSFCRNFFNKIIIGHLYYLKQIWFIYYFIILRRVNLNLFFIHHWY